MHARAHTDMLARTCMHDTDALHYLHAYMVAYLHHTHVLHAIHPYTHVRPYTNTLRADMRADMCTYMT